MNRSNQDLGSGIQLAFTDNAEEQAVFLPTDNFCVRKPAAIFLGGKYWLYVDVIPWDHPFWPDTYDTSIHAFSSNDCREWDYHGEVVTHRQTGAWDFGGVATPGAVVLDDRIYLFYSGREFPGRDGVRQIGMAVAENPQGPFIKAEQPVIVPRHPESHLDDPIPILSEDGKGIDLYFRRADHQLSPSEYAIRLTKSFDNGQTWSDPVDVLHSDEKIRAYETAEVARIGDQVLLSTFDHFAEGGCKTAFRMSKDGVNFTDCPDLYLDDHLCDGWDAPSCMLQIVLIPDADGINRHLGITRNIDEYGHYNQAIYGIEIQTD